MVLNQEGFNQWAANYDQSVAQSQQEQSYPFAGYDEVLARIEKRIAAHPGALVLDAGFGTGVLTERLARAGAVLSGFDFASAMVDSVKKKLPQAQLFIHDFNDGWPAVLAEDQFDFIVSTYALHHCGMADQIAWIQAMTAHLKPQGQVLIGDIAFENEEAYKLCRRQAASRWDAEETYLTREQLQSVFGGQFTWERCSFCAALMIFKAC